MRSGHPNDQARESQRDDAGSERADGRGCLTRSVKLALRVRRFFSQVQNPAAVRQSTFREHYGCTSGSVSRDNRLRVESSKLSGQRFSFQMSAFCPARHLPAKPSRHVVALAKMEASCGGWSHVTHHFWQTLSF